MNRPASPRPVEAAARFCLSCAGTCLCWLVWLVLGALLAAQVYVLVARELPVPAFALRRLDARLAELGLAADFRAAQFDPSGKLLLEGARVRSRQFEDPLLHAGSIYVRKSIWSVLSGDRAPDEIRLDAATLNLPAPLSPTGMAAPLVSDLAATLHLGDNLLRIDQLSFRAGNLAVSIRGDFQPPATPAREPADIPALIHRALQDARRLARELPQLEVLDEPRLDVQLSVRPGIGNVAELSLTAQGWRESDRVPLATGPLLARAIVRLDGRDPRPLRVQFTSRALRLGAAAATARLDGSAIFEFTPGVGAELHHASAELALADVEAFDERASVPVLDLHWTRGSPIEFALDVGIDGEAMSVRGTVDPERRIAAAEFDGRVAPSIVSSVLPVRAPKFAPYFRFGDPVIVHGSVAFAPGWRFDGLRTRVRVGRLDSHDVQITSARGRIDIDAEGNFLAHDACVVAGENHARGSYWMNFRSMDYRMLLTGALRPPHIAGWFRTDWWLDFWQNFSFGPPPVADVDVGGNWRDVSRSLYFGSTDALEARVLEADFEVAHARVFVRPHFAHAFDLHATRAGGEQRAEGWFKRIADPVTRELEAFEYDLRGNLEPVTLRRLGGPTAETLLEPWVFGRPPQIAFRGRTRFVDGASVPDLSFTGSANGGFSFEGFPIEQVDVRGTVRGDRVQLDPLRFQVAGGRGSGTASVTGEGRNRRLEFDVRIDEADMVRTIGALTEFEQQRKGTDEQAPANRELLKRASGGKLQISLAAAGPPSDLTLMEGQGNLLLTGAELGEIHLFGLLSQVLSGLSLNFSSLKLDTMRTSFRLANGLAHFPDLRVSGSTAVIEGKGDYRLKEQTLDFTARLKPYEENRNLFTAAIGIVINPLTSILELRLTGPIQKPNWSISFGSSGARDGAPPATGGGETAQPPPPPRKEPAA